MPDTIDLIVKHEREARRVAVEQDGFAYFPGVVGSSVVGQLRTAFDRLTANPESFDHHDTPEDRGFLNKHINNAFNFDPVFLRCMDLPGVIDTAEDVLGDDCHVLAMTAWITGPGRPDQDLHCDWIPMTMPADVLADPRINVPAFIVTAHLYLNDMYEDLGPTKIVPGSHKSGRNPDGDTHWGGIGEKSILCKAGDVVMFRSDVWHRGSANKSVEDRYLIQVNYSQRVIAQRFPPYLNKFQFNPEIVSMASPRQIRLMGDHVSGNYA